MNADTNTTNTTSPRLSLENAVRRMYRKFCAEMRRGIQLTIQKYQHGIHPPF